MTGMQSSRVGGTRIVTFAVFCLVSAITLLLPVRSRASENPEIDRALSNMEWYAAQNFDFSDTLEAATRKVFEDYARIVHQPEELRSPESAKAFAKQFADDFADWALIAAHSAQGSKKFRLRSHQKFCLQGLKQLQGLGSASAVNEEFENAFRAELERVTQARKKEIDSRRQLLRKQLLFVSPLEAVTCTLSAFAGAELALHFGDTRAQVFAAGVASFVASFAGVKAMLDIEKDPQMVIYSVATEYTSNTQEICAHLLHPPEH